MANTFQWDVESTDLNLLTALTLISRLLSTCELNMDDMEQPTRQAVTDAGEFLLDAQNNGWAWDDGDSASPNASHT